MTMTRTGLKAKITRLTQENVELKVALAEATGGRRAK